MKVALFWFRRDLRLEDNRGLLQALNSGYPVLPIFIFDENILSELPKDDARLTFIHQQLEKINTQLAPKNTSILCLKGVPKEVWKQLLESYEVTAVFANKDYEPYARIRDKEVADLLEQKGIALHRIKDQVIFEERDILKADGKPYTVYTPYKNRWLANFDATKEQPVVGLNQGVFFEHKTPFLSLEDIGFVEASIKVAPYDFSQLAHYEDKRDYPIDEITTLLGPHLRFGTISVRQIIADLEQGDAVFLSQLVWREFFMQILYHFPKVVDRNFRAKYDGIDWRNNEQEFGLWCQGKTGYPMVDAGMRQLNETGYMHNRVRMVVASFLCKHLLIDWRWGEAYFASKLLDYELAANNGNWQWAAGTGCDAAPYFRIFNPTTQLKKFDKTLAYVKQWIPEYGTTDYPLPIVDHKEARERALAGYKAGILTV